MPEIGHCPHCGAEVSARGVECGSCGMELNVVPTSIGLDLIESLRDADLGMVFFKYVALQMERAGCYRIDGPRDRVILQQMPPGLVAGWTLVVLDSEVLNGGFYQWLTNSSGQTTDLALHSLKLIGAEKHLDLVQQVISIDEKLGAAYPHYARRFERPEPRPEREMIQAFWADVEQSYQPELDRLDSEYYDVGNFGSGAKDDLWKSFERYVRRHPRDCVHTQFQH